MSRIREHMTADRRLAILRLLVEAGGECGESSIEKSLRSLGFGSLLDREVVQQDFRFLAGVHCIDIEYYDARIMVAAITKQGVRCAGGLVEIEGISKPSQRGRD